MTEVCYFGQRRFVDHDMALEFNATRDKPNIHVSIYNKGDLEGTIYEIKTKIHSTKQGTLFLIECYNIMEGLLLGLDYYQNVKMKCSERKRTH